MREVINLRTLSTVGTAVTGGGSFDDEDVFAYSVATTLFEPFWDGTAFNLTTEAEDVNGLWADPTNNKLYLTTVGAFAIPGSSGDGADIFICRIGGGCDPGLFWNGSAHGLGTAQVDGLSLASEPYALCETFANGGFEQQFRCWAATSQFTDIKWLPTTNEAYSGRLSAKGEIIFPQLASTDAFLISSPLAVQPNTRYRFQFFGKKTGPGVDTDIWSIHASVRWFQNGQPLGLPTDVGGFHWNAYPTDWTLFSIESVCPPPGADVGRWQFVLQQTSNSSGAPPVELFMEDVSITSQPGACPVH
ncbi:MAG: hypothetical protein IPM39_26795 [Chloroflexi bacterium]|nr:hypothetical protein [Chloroflexota bacterium]